MARPIPPATLHRIYNDHPWTDARSYRPDPIEMLRDRLNERRPSWFAEVTADWRDIISEVRGSPYSHALVGIATVIAWTVVLVVPTLIGVGK